ncbi:MAG: type II toxin-antitoxin system VapC family toxin [Candidatus Thiothrix singaporensis]|uniref:Ribonuclease VapC n=1 Tax=Candidatus Thiothrix singaporensis TaxID=2799669 RepID=A0A7L6ATA1_9GAMM|nr:MAG: type II toxin-antitoxin system VapC family toxin [Candidatus Thiothrix singaporensis]
MIAVDTNVLVRVLTDDKESPEQTRQARALVTAAGRVFVPQVVQVEFVWVLEQAYGFEKEEVMDALQVLWDDPVYCLQHETHFILALTRFRNSNAGFADSIIAVESRQVGMDLWTFDRKLGKQDGVQRLTQESLTGYAKHAG